MKFKITVTKVFSQEFYVNADDEDHASEACEELECNWKTEVDSEWKVKQVKAFSDSSIEVYTPQQDYLN